MKLVGVAGAVGVAATGALVVRNERQRRAYTPDEVREQLHVRYARATAAAPPIDTAAAPPIDTAAAPPIDTASPLDPPSAQSSSQDASESDGKRALGEWGRRLGVRVQRLARRDQ